MGPFLKIIVLIILMLLLGSAVGFYFWDRYRMQQVCAFLDQFTPLILRKPSKSRQMTTMSIVMNTRKLAVVDCRRCHGTFLRKHWCSACSGKGYIVIGTNEISDMDLPNFRGLIKFLENERFEHLSDKGVIKEMIGNTDHKAS